MVHKLATTLHPNQWLHVGNFNDFDNTKIINNDQPYFFAKPKGIWSSKGEWIFKEDKYLTLLEIDYSKILVLTTKKDLIDFEKHYCKLTIFKPFKFNFTKTLSKLWFYINKKTGINLRDREKLYPIFKQLSRIFGTKEYNTLYRGVRLPKGPFENLLTEMTVGTGDPDLRVLTILENLAYGLRSWTSKKDIAIQGWGVRPGETRDVVIFKIHNPDIVLDTNQFTRVIQQDFGIFDLHEVIIYLKDPEVLDIEVLSPGVYLITVVDKG